MNKVGRPKGEEKVLWRVRVSIALAAKVDLLLFDPVNEITRYGSKAALMETLLTEWVRAQEKPNEST